MTGVLYYKKSDGTIVPVNVGTDVVVEGTAPPPDLQPGSLFYDTDAETVPGIGMIASRQFPDKSFAANTWVEAGTVSVKLELGRQYKITMAARAITIGANASARAAVVDGGIANINSAGKLWIDSYINLNNTTNYASHTEVIVRDGDGLTHTLGYCFSASIAGMVYAPRIFVEEVGPRGSIAPAMVPHDHPQYLQNVPTIWGGFVAGTAAHGETDPITIQGAARTVGCPATKVAQEIVFPTGGAWLVRAWASFTGLGTGHWLEMKIKLRRSGSDVYEVRGAAWGHEALAAKSARAEANDVMSFYPGDSIRFGCYVTMPGVQLGSAYKLSGFYCVQVRADGAYEGLA